MTNRTSNFSIVGNPLGFFSLLFAAAVLVFAGFAFSGRSYATPTDTTTTEVSAAPLFDSGWTDVTGVSHPLDVSQVLATLNLRQSTTIRVHVGYRGAALVENLTDETFTSTPEHPAYSFANGVYFWVGNMNSSGATLLAPCTTLYGTDLLATDGLPDDIPGDWNGDTYLDMGDCHVWPVEIPDALGPIDITLPPGRHPIMGASYGIMTSVNGQPLPPYQGHGPCRALQMGVQVRIWATKVN